MSDREAKKNNSVPERAPAGGGRLRPEGALVALLGFSELDTFILEKELNERCALLEKDLNKAEYLIYDPAFSVSSKEEWQQALLREEEGALVMMPFPVYKFWLRKNADVTGVRTRDWPCVIVHYLTHTADWQKSISGADKAAETVLNERHLSLAEAYYEKNDITALLLLLDALKTREEEWVKTGYSDGYYTCLLEERFLQKSIEANATEITLRLLEHRHSRFGEELVKAAELAQTEYELGIRKRPLVYWSKGTVHALGSYPQTAAGNEKIEWLVLDRKEDRALLISRCILERKAYNEERIAVMWDICTLRKWLNGPFLRKAFSREERGKLIRTFLPAAKNERYTTLPGTDTRDRIFLLSPYEAKQYFFSDKERMAETTDLTDLPIFHTVNNNIKNGRHTLMWWLRGNSSQQVLAPYVDASGEITESGGYADYGFYGVRPAMWVRID